MSPSSAPQAMKTVQMRLEQFFSDFDHEHKSGGFGHIRAADENDKARARWGVVHVDHLVNKINDVEFGLLMGYMLKKPVEVVFLQGAKPLEKNKEMFEKFLTLLRRKTIWSINLGELRFSSEQLEQLEEALEDSWVTHMFYECTVAGPWKVSRAGCTPSCTLSRLFLQVSRALGLFPQDVYRAIIRDNRSKHSKWRLGSDHAGNHMLLQSVKNWFNPINHSQNKVWAQRNGCVDTNLLLSLSPVAHSPYLAIAAKAGSM
jgi:hypothetical protein